MWGGLLGWQVSSQQKGGVSTWPDVRGEGVRAWDGPVGRIRDLICAWELCGSSVVDQSRCGTGAAVSAVPCPSERGNTLPDTPPPRPDRYEVDKLTASQRLDLNLEKGRIRDELQALRDMATEMEIKVGAVYGRGSGRPACGASRPALQGAPVQRAAGLVMGAVFSWKLLT